MKKIGHHKNYQQFLNANEYCGIYYSSEDCGVCNTMKPKVEEIYTDLDMPIIEMSINEFREIAGQQLILKSPTIILYHRGKELFRDSGFIDLPKIERNINLILS